MAKSVYVPQAGGIIDFPDEATPQQMLSYIEGTYGARSTATPVPETPVGPDESTLFGRFAYGFGRGLTDVPGGIAALAMPAEKAAESYLGGISESSRKFLEEQLGIDPTKDPTAAQQAAQALGSVGSFILPGGLATKGAQAAGLAARTAGRVGTVTAAAQGVAIGAEQRAERIREQLASGMNISEEDQLASQRLSGLIGASEALPLERFFGPISTLLSKVPVSKAPIVEQIVKSRLAKITKAGVAEGAQEVASGIANDLVEKGVYNPDVEIGQDLMSNFGTGAFAGSFVEGLIQLAAGRKLRPYRQLQEDLGREAAVNAQAQRQGEISRAAEELRKVNVEGDVEVVEDDFDGISRFTIRTPGGNTVGDFLDPAEAEEAVNIYKQRTDANVTIRKPADLPSVFPVKINGKEYQTTDEIIADRDSLVSKSEGLAAYMSRPDVIKREAERQNVSEALVKKATDEEVADLTKKITKLNEFVAAAGLEEGDLRSRFARPPEAVATETPASEAMVPEAIAPEAPIGAVEPVSVETPITGAPAIAEPVEPSVAPTEPEETRTSVGQLKEAPVRRRTLTQAEAEGPILRDYNQATIDRYASIYTELKSRLSGKVPKNAEVKLEELISTDKNLLVRGQARIEKTPNGIKSIVDLSTGILRPDMSVEAAVKELVGTLNHEIIHVLRDQGVIRPAEWNILSKAVVNTKVPGKKYTYMDKAQAIYTPYGQPITPVYTDPDAVIEEAVAEMYKDWVNNQTAPKQTRGLFNRITEFFRSIFRVLKSNKYEELFKAIDTGEVGAREGVGREAMEGARFSAAPVRPAAIQTERGFEIAAIPKDSDSSSVYLRRDFGPVKGKVNIVELGKAFDRAFVKRFGRQYDISNPEDYKKIVAAVVDEVNHQMSQAQSGVGWYDNDIQDVFDELSKSFPILKEPGRGAVYRQTFTVIAGIMSNGMKAKQNVEFGATNFAHFMNTGKFSSNNPFTKTGWNQRSNIMGPQIDMLNSMISDPRFAPRPGSNDPTLERLEKFLEWMFSEHSVREINQFRAAHGTKSPAKIGNVNDRRLGMYAFGPKFGPFILNLNGLTDETVDSWASRSFYRHMGRSVNPNGEMNDAPTGPAHREAMKQALRDVATKAKLSSRDVQAVLWFYEKELYNQLGQKIPLEVFSDGAREFTRKYGAGAARSSQPRTDREREIARSVETAGTRESPGSPGTETVRFSAAPVEERDAAFQRLADGQRYLPEYAMLDVQKAMGGGVISHAVEHTGDLTHRISEKFSYLEGQQGIVDQKVSSVLRALKNPYGFAREFEDNIRSNAAFSKTTPEKVREAVWKALDNYANEHAKLEVFNEPQRLARDAAVALGRRKYAEATRLLEKLKVYSGGDPDAYKAAVGEYNPAPPDGVRFSAAPALNTEEFARWFKNSKVVKPDGTPMVMYHGTPFSFKAFGKSRSAAIGGEEGPFFFSASPKFANQYAETRLYKGAYGEDVKKGGRVLPVYISAQNPFDYENDSHIESLKREIGDISPSLESKIRDGIWKSLEAPAIQRAIRRLGFDGVYLNEAGFKNLAVYRPEQVKSIFNQFEEGAATSPRLSAAPLPPYVEAKNRTLFVPERKESVFQSISDFFRGPTTMPKTLNTVYGQIDMRGGYFGTRANLYRRMSLVDQDAYIEFLEKTANEKDTGNFQRREATQSAIAALGWARRSSQLTAATVMQGPPVIEYSRPGDIQSATVAIRDDADKLIDIFRVMLEPGPVDPVTGEPRDKRVVFKSYATAKRAIGLKAAGKPVPRELDDVYINTTIQSVQRDYPEIVEAYEKYQRFNKKLITAARDAGRITDAELAKFTQQMDYYGFYRELYEEQLVPGMPSKLAGDIKIREYKGSERGELIEDPMLVILTNVNFWMGAITRNIAANKAFKLAQDMGEARLLGASEKPDLSQGESEQVMFFRENGVQKRFAVKDPMLVASLGANDNMDMGRAMKLLGVMPATVLRESITRDPVFMVRNLLRDTLSTWVTSGEDITPIIGTVKGWRDALNNSTSFQALVGRGVVGSHDLAMRSPAEMAAIIRRRALPVNVMNVASIDGMQGLVMSAWDKLGVWSEASDAATRIAVYEAAIKQGMSEAEAAFRAIEIMNFSRRGSNSFLQILTQIIPFLNARIQGLDVLYQAGKAGVMTATGYQLGERDANLGKKFLYRGAILMALSVALEAMLEGDEDYEELPDYVKNGNLLIPLKWFGVEGGYFAAYPKPFEAGLLFSTIPQELYKAATGQSSGREMAKFFWSEFTSTFGLNPIPQAMIPGLEALVNYDFYTDLPLISEGKARLTPELQYDSRTSSVAMMLSGVPIKYNFTTGKFEGVSPIIIDQMISGYGGPMGSYLMQGIGLLMEGTGAVEERLPRDITQLPAIKSFLLDAESRSPKSVAQAYELFRVVDEVNRSFSRLRQTGDVEATMDYLERNKDVLAYKKYIYKLFDGLNKISARERQIERDETMTREQKFEAMKQLREVRARLTSNIAEINKALGR